MITPKLYLYDSSATDYKGTDYSQYILSGFNYTDDLTEVLDTCEITLVGLSRSEEFAPTTKFILEIYNSIDGSDILYDTYDLMVADDVVEQPILSDDTYFKHSITFNEASVVAQGRIVDDMTETYELKDVSLDILPTYNVEETCEEIIAQQVPSGQTGINNGTTTEGVPYVWETVKTKVSRTFRYVFGDEYGLTGNISDWKNFLRNQVATGGAKQITLPIPLIATKIGKQGTAEYETEENFCSTKTMVFVRDLGSNNEWQLDTTVNGSGIIITNPSTSNATENAWDKDWDLYYLTQGYILNRKEAYIDSGTSLPLVRTYYKKVANFDNVVQNRTLTLTILPSKEYKIVVTLNDISTSNDELGLTAYNVYGDTNNLVCYSSYSETFTATILYSTVKDNSAYFITNTETAYSNNPILEMSFNSWAESPTGETIFQSAPPLSAYDLFIDAQLKSQETWRGDNYIKDPSQLPYYCEQVDIDKLKNAQIIESGFHQKNFWEILLEIGKYIHAIPYIKFGENDRYLVTWHYLGLPTQYDSETTTMSIFNSRSIENYVGALNSYVNNMVQLGGLINEVVAPKTESDDYLVYNDTAIIKTSKPIIEIYADENNEKGVIAKCIRYNSDCPIAENATADITKYAFEYSIYELLGVSAGVEPNKGLGIYYNLGENVIRGLNYQLPSVNTGDGDTEYAIKRILGTAFNMQKTTWKDIKINDFIFTITYRTKENVRSEQSRPDLRKYLINSAYETIPHHKQFNNQQDVSVDSVKFGNQTYGKLIKTGNTEIKTTEWNNDLDTIKKSGQLYNIRGNIYYVARIVNTFFQDHIDSEITYSKDYNQLSEIIGIPSEPRFYEISERNIIDRQVNINNYMVLGTQLYNGSTKYLNLTETSEYIRDLLFSTGTSYPKYAFTQFKNDSANPNIQNFNKEIVSAISGYSMRNTLSLKWEMVDNFSAGDSVDDINVNDSADDAYATLMPTQYVDKYGRVDLIDFVIVDTFPFGNSEVKALPNSPLRILNSGLYRTYMGYGATYSQLGIIDTTIDPQTTESFYINNGGNIKDSNSNVIVDYSSASVGEYVLVNDGTYSALYYCSEHTSVAYIWERKVLVYGTLTEYETTTIKPTTQTSYNRLFASDFSSQDFGALNHGLALVKDNRERVMFNFNTQMLTDSDRFVLSGYMWRQNKEGSIVVVALEDEVNKIVNDTISIPLNTTTYPIQTTQIGSRLQINISTILSGVDVSNVKSIAIISTAKPMVGSGTENYFVMARNVGDLDDADKVADWYISAPTSDFFEKQ